MNITVMRLHGVQTSGICLVIRGMFHETLIVGVVGKFWSYVHAGSVHVVLFVWTNSHSTTDNKLWFPSFDQSGINLPTKQYCVFY